MLICVRQIRNMLHVLHYNIQSYKWSPDETSKINKLNKLNKKNIFIYLKLCSFNSLGRSRQAGRNKSQNQIMLHSYHSKYNIS